jgi:hypothetical protein
MSSDSRPISPTQFAAAIKDLPISNLYAKAAELRNSMAHLVSSNEQLAEFAATDKDCADAIHENEVVLQRIEERILLLQFEVEVNRSLKWVEQGQDHNLNPTAQASVPEVGEAAVEIPQQATNNPTNGVEDPLGADDDDDDDDDEDHGIHL